MSARTGRVTTRSPRTHIEHTRSLAGREEHRCLVPVTAFSEPTDKPNPQTRKKGWYWFALDDSQPPIAFAGYSKAISAILTTPEEFNTRASAPIEEALRLLRPLPDQSLKVVGMGREASKPAQPSQPSLM
jgi:putative SOS response-associated peptidase YedK